MKVIFLISTFFLFVNTAYSDPYRVIVIRHGEKEIVPDTSGIRMDDSQANPTFGQALDTDGVLRSLFLVGYFLGIPSNNQVNFDSQLQAPLFSDMVTIGGTAATHPITYIAARSTKPDGGGAVGTGSFRPVATIAPLANSVFPNLAPTSVNDFSPASVPQIDDTQPVGMGDYTFLLTQINLAQNNNNTVILCWESNRIPYVLLAINNTITSTDDWKSTFFKDKDGIWKWIAKTFDKTFVITPSETPIFKVFKQPFP